MFYHRIIMRIFDLSIKKNVCKIVNYETTETFIQNKLKT